MDHRHYKLISFDLDDTLWPVTPVIEKANKTTYHWLLQHYPEIREHFKPEQIAIIRRQLIKDDPHLLHQISLLRTLCMRTALIHAGCDQDKAENLANEAFEVFIRSRHEVELFEGALESLARLKQHYTLCALTNGNADFQRLGLDKYFSFAFSSEQLNASKPAPNHFLAALNHTQIDAAQMIHIGDHQEHDIWAAQQLEITTVWVNRSRDIWQSERLPDMEVKNLKQLVNAIETLENNVLAK